MEGGTPGDTVLPSVSQLFDEFLHSGTCKHILSSFQLLCERLELKHTTHRHFYRRLRSLVTSWKAQTVWAKLDKRAGQKEYKKGEACLGTRALVIGAGPCGLRTAIELALLGSRVVLVEKRDSFSRNNVLHLWPFLITDLKNLGAKKFFGKFCAGAIDHISIRQLQCILMKVALILGVEIHTNVGFVDLLEPPETQPENHGIGWRCKTDPPNHAVSEYEFDVLIGADGKRNTLSGFRRKEFRGKLAIAITANFINSNTQQEARVEEISGVAFIFNQKFFKDLNEKTGIDLENIVYYKDETHYFVMTAKKTSLLEKEVLIRDYPDTASLLSPANVNREKLLGYAREAADFSTEHQLPRLQYAINHYGQPDVAMFDFTSMFAALNASIVMERHKQKLLVGLVGDSLLEPFWPTGSGCARGFLSALDAAWMVRSWASARMTPLEVLAERESVYQLLSQTTPENLNKNFNDYSIDPNSRYPNLNHKAIKPEQVRHLLDNGDGTYNDEVIEIPYARSKNSDIVDSYTLLRWCQNLLNGGRHKNVHITDFTHSWKNGYGFAALVNVFKADLVDLNTLSSSDNGRNCQLAFEKAQDEFGINCIMNGQEFANCIEPDKLVMVTYLSQFYNKFRKERSATFELPKELEKKESTKGLKSPHHRMSILQKLRLSRSKKRKDKEDKDHEVSFSKKVHLQEQVQPNGDIQLTKYNKLPINEIANRLTTPYKKEEDKKTQDNQPMVKVSAMAEALAAKFRVLEQTPIPTTPTPNRKNPGVLLAAQASSEVCYFCKKRVYLMERMSAQNVFFHRECFKCDFCQNCLRLSNYSHERTLGGEVKFYCFRHSRPETRITRIRRKRSWLNDDHKENIPKIIIDTGKSPTSSPKKRADGSPKKIPLPLSPPLIPDGEMVQPKKTPERIEFENSIDGIQEEESEEELTEHNLRASLSSDAILLDEENENFSDSDLECSDDEDFQKIQEVMNNSMDFDREITLEDALEIVHTLKRQSRENLLDLGSEDNQDEDEEDTPEEDNEEGTEKEDNDQVIGKTSQEIAVSPVNSMKDKRANFFATPPDVVRLDPFKLFGMGKTDKEAKTQQEESTAVLPASQESSDAVQDVGSDVEATENQVKTAIYEEGEDDRENEDTEDDFEEVFNSCGEDEVDEVDIDAEYDYNVDEENADMFEKPDERIASGDDNNAENDFLPIEKDSKIEENDKDSNMLGDTDEADMEESDDQSKVNAQMEQLLQDIDHRSSVSDAGNGEFQGPSDLSEEEGEEEEDASSTKDTEKVVLESVQRTSDRLGSGDTTLQEVLNSVQNMDNQGKNENICVDERFVTKRVTRRKAFRKKRAPGSFACGDSDSSFTISTPSHSRNSSVNSIPEEFSNTVPLESSENEDDSNDLVREYQMTLTQKLEEDNSEEELANVEQDDTLEDNTCVQETFTDTVSDFQTPNRSRECVTTHSSDDYSEGVTSKDVDLEIIVQSKNDDINSGGKYILLDGSSIGETNVDDICPESKEPSSEQTNETARKTNSDGSAWRPLPPIPIDQLKNKPTELFKKSDSTNSNNIYLSKSSGSASDSSKEGGRRLPDISAVANRNSEQSSFQSKFMREKCGSPSLLSDSISSGKEGSSSPEMKKYTHPVSSQMQTSVSSQKSSENSWPSSSSSSKKEPAASSSSSSRKDLTATSSSSSKKDLTTSSSENFSSQGGRLKINVDKSLLLSNEDVSKDIPKAVPEESHSRRKICVDQDLKQSFEDIAPNGKLNKPKTSVGQHIIDDIPFADDSEDDKGVDVYYTPASSMKPKPQPFIKPNEEHYKEVRKRLLPTPPSQNTKSVNSQPNRNMEREIAREKARMKSDQELGISCTPIAGHWVHSHSRPESADDFALDSDDKLAMQSTNPAHSTPVNEGVRSSKPVKEKKKKERKKSTTTTSKSSEKSDSEGKKSSSKKRKSLLSMLRPKKDSEKSRDSVDRMTSSNDTLDEKQDSDKKKKKKKSPKSDKKKKKVLSSTPGSDAKGMPVGPVFTQGNGTNLPHRRKIAYKGTLPPRAQSEDFSDSDDSYLSHDTLSRKKRDRRILTEEENDIRRARRVQSEARKQNKQKQQKRHRLAQEIQRKLEEVDVKQKELEERGVAVEKALRGEGPDAGKAEKELMQEWFNLVYEKNSLVRYESELTVNAQYMELEDRQARLEQELREHMAVDHNSESDSSSIEHSGHFALRDLVKTQEQVDRERKILDDLVLVVEERNKLVAMLEEDRLREQEEDNNLRAVMEAKGYDIYTVDPSKKIKMPAEFPLSG